MTNHQVLKKLTELWQEARIADDEVLAEVYETAVHAVQSQGTSYEKKKYSPELQEIYRLGYRAGYQTGRYKMLTTKQP